MRPITFRCRAALPLPPHEIAAQILDLTRWPEFTGYGPLPGIRAAEFDVQMPAGRGARIRVHNTDGSTHVEEIVCWELPQRLALELKEFSPPLSRLARRFIESWEFQTVGTATMLTRTMEMEATSRWTRPVLWLISRLLKRAVARHLRGMARQAEREKPVAGAPSR